MHYSPHMLPKVRSKKIMAEMAQFPSCTLRIASFIPGGKCSGNDTLVGCHLPTIGKGLSTKVTDLAVACGCARCHDILDGRDQNAQEFIVTNYPAAMMERLMNGLVETHSILIERGVIAVPDGEII